ncbi:VOC family protein [Galactobacter sp.]|uniref:VOC family protein n=1 Tax=Galactobacter sp. TaxID=2676125 RepID=UPI0025BCC8B9|nr:VOC family protein [Galactobacter sp.]
MVSIVPHLWFDGQVRAAVEFYTELFPDSEITGTAVMEDTPGGDTVWYTFRLWGQEFQAIDGGPFFTPNPSVSFFVNVDPSRVAGARGEVDRIVSALTDGGTELMPLGEYPFSPHYAWVQDRFGISWQVMLTNPEGEPRPPIVPSLAFGNSAVGGAAAARSRYLELFDDAVPGSQVRFADMGMPEGSPEVPADGVAYSDVRLAGTWFALMDTPGFPDVFNEGISLMIRCDSQEEMDRYWAVLSTVPEAEQCGWCKDEFGLSWQVVPKELDTMLLEGTLEQAKRVQDAFMPMHKLDLEALRAAYRGD